VAISAAECPGTSNEYGFIGTRRVKYTYNFGKTAAGKQQRGTKRGKKGKIGEAYRVSVWPDQESADTMGPKLV
tara:strand:+ start:64 stop:282 length:219 start_codon:yes stop_codon:yes gene_type:complete